MGRLILSAAIASLLLLPNPGEAQTGAAPPPPPAPRGGSFGVTIRQDPAPRPSPGRPGPAAPVGPLVPPAPPSALDTVDIFQARPRTYAPRYNRVPRQRFPGGYGGYGYVTDPFGYISQSDYTSRPADDSDPRDRDGIGYLRLEVQPETARVYVDGLYVGSVSDFRRAACPLDAGPHRVEFRADGYETQSVRSASARTTRCCIGERSHRSRSKPNLRPATPKTFYVIKGCYAGDTRPRADLALPAGCRVGNLRTIPPVVAPPARRNYRGCGTIRMYGRGGFQPPETLLGFLLRDGRGMITSSPCFQSAGVATCFVAVS